MKKSILAILLCMFMIVSLIPTSVMAGTIKWTDNGIYNAELYASEAGNWKLYTAADLAAFAKKTLDGATFEDYTVTLENDICINGYDWVPISGFKGIFDGQGYTISGTAESSEHQGYSIFANLYNGKIMNLRSECNFTSSYVGSSAFVAGICGNLNRGTIENCISTGNITASGSSNRNYAGGICGYGNSGTINNCVVFNTATSSGATYINFYGALYGYSYTQPTLFKNCYSLLRGDPVVTCLSEAQMKGAPASTDESWVNINVGDSFSGKRSLVDALNAWVTIQDSPSDYVSWSADEDGNNYPYFDITREDVWVSGVRFDSRLTTIAPRGEGTATLDTTTTPYTLTLNNATISSDTYGIYSKRDIKIVLSGNSYITAGKNADGNSYGIYVSPGTLTVGGTGSLTVKSCDVTGDNRHSVAVFSMNQLTIGENVRVIARSGSSNGQYATSFAIESGSQGITISDGARVYAYGGDASAISTGIGCFESLSIEDNAYVSAHGGYSDSDLPDHGSYGLQVSKLSATISVSDNATFAASGQTGAVNREVQNGNSGTDIYAGDEFQSIPLWNGTDDLSTFKYVTVNSLWSSDTNTDWYDSTADNFVIDTPQQLAGFAKLVNSGVSFADKNCGARQ